MQIEIEGSRSSDQAWREARVVPLEKLWGLTRDEIAWSSPDDQAAAQIARRSYAIDLTQPELVAKCEKLARLTSDWIRQAGLQWRVTLVRLRCLRGVFDLEVDADDQVHKLEIREDLLDDLLQAGSRDALEAMDRLFSANFGRFPALKAS